MTNGTGGIGRKLILTNSTLSKTEFVENGKFTFSKNSSTRSNDGVHEPNRWRIANSEDERRKFDTQTRRRYSKPMGAIPNSGHRAIWNSAHGLNYDIITVLGINT